jgi:hypothetical protein
MESILPQDDPQLAPLINELGELIRQARQKVLRAVVTRYSVLQGHEQLFASQYQLVLPTEEELREALDCERARLEESPRTQRPEEMKPLSINADSKNPCSIDAFFFSNAPANELHSACHRPQPTPL